MSEVKNKATPSGRSKGKSVSAPKPPFKPGKFGVNERQVVDYIKTATSRNIWYYRDRLNTARGPCSLPVLREAWVQGIVDENTLIWGQGLADWLPIRNVRTLVPQIRTVEVQISTWFKKNFALKPAIQRARKHQGAALRPEPNPQVDRMY